MPATETMGQPVMRTAPNDRYCGKPKQWGAPLRRAAVERSQVTDARTTSSKGRKRSTSARPAAVNWYSVRGGRSGRTSRETRPVRTRSSRVSAKVEELIRRDCSRSRKRVPDPWPIRLRMDMVCFLAIAYSRFSAPQQQCAPAEDPGSAHPQAPVSRSDTFIVCSGASPGWDCHPLCVRYAGMDSCQPGEAPATSQCKPDGVERARRL